ncbi:hypothetical protein TraAM80_09764, partial [Trypanosoma rangeli]
MPPAGAGETGWAPSERPRAALMGKTWGWFVLGRSAGRQAKCGHEARKGMARVGPVRRGVSDPRGCQIANSRHGSVGQIAIWAANCYSRLNETDLRPCTVPAQDRSAAVRVVEGRGTG